jgi:hypothetical protein
MDSENSLPKLISTQKKMSASIRRYVSPSRIYWRRGYTFGQGKRSPVENSTGRGSPPPGSYNINSIFDKISNGPILRGLANEQHSFRRVSNLPGPGSYNPYLPLGENAPKYSLKPRLEMQIRSKSPGPSCYYPNFRATQNTKFSGISFGAGINDRQKNPKRHPSPGPGSYEIPSIFSNTLADFPIPK